MLGIEYAYKSGYDPRAMIDLFERINADESGHASGRLAKAFSTHPMTSDRVLRAQQEVTYLLPPKPDYIETTSDFEQMKSRLAYLQSVTRIRVVGPGRTMRVRDENSRSAINTQPAGIETTPPAVPVLHRRDLDSK
ncbi:MAG: hypothetical protein NVS9B15_19370 [Acidobacteriaceae bacterium]